MNPHAAVNDAGKLEVPGRRLPTADIDGKAAHVCMRAYMDDDGGLLMVEYPPGGLSVELGAAIMANLIKDTLGDEPDLRDVMTMQRALVAIMQGGESVGVSGGGGRKASK